MLKCCFKSVNVLLPYKIKYVSGFSSVCFAVKKFFINEELQRPAKAGTNLPPRRESGVSETELPEKNLRISEFLPKNNRIYYFYDSDKIIIFCSEN